ncbi:MAG: hypothetical protein ACOY58_03660, partial [Candidatus Micrarchaeota archaeon]
MLALGCTQQVACPADARLCPDGTAVGRVGPDCEFAPCPQLVGNDSDEHGCIGSAGYSWCDTLQECVRSWETPCPMTEADALGIARENCDAVVATDAMYNEDSDTWWFGMDVDQPGCNPACVVFGNGSAEVNWRCTGVIVYTVKSANSSLGEILVDNGGYTLYRFTPDTEGVSTCYDTCEADWPPLILGGDTISIPNGLPGEFGAIMRVDGSTQVTYDGMPLYYYAGDDEPGD